MNFLIHIYIHTYIIDSAVTFQRHISSMVSSYFYQLRQMKSCLST